MDSLYVNPRKIYGLPGTTVINSFFQRLRYLVLLIKWPLHCWNCPSFSSGIEKDRSYFLAILLHNIKMTMMKFGNVYCINLDVMRDKGDLRVY